MGILDKIFNFFFYRSKRVGIRGKIFYLYKFRTMVHGADKGNPSVAGDDPRVTRLGRILRKYKIDEIPNLINILKGDMVIIGPRPDVPFYICGMPREYRAVILSVKPGLIDLATRHNLNEGERLKGKEDPEKYYKQEIWPEKIVLQCIKIRRRKRK